MSGRDSDTIIIRALKIIIILTAIALAAWLYLKYFAGATVVDGMSMYPTLEDGDVILVDKKVQDDEYERYDMIMFEVSKTLSPTGYYVKRIIGLPGEHVRIDKKGNIYINGINIIEKYGQEKMTDPGLALTGVRLGKDEYFCLGDNRNHSEDSRFKEVGNVKKDSILGRIEVRIWPMKKYGYIDLYRDRTQDK